jgi:outer membrane protein TolC
MMKPPVSSLRRLKAIALVLWILLPSGRLLYAQQPEKAADTFYVGLTGAIRRALDVSPEVANASASRDFADARWDQARASRFLPEFQVSTAHSLAPGLKGTGDTPHEILYLNPDVRNDWEDLRMFNRIEAQAVQPLYTWGELSESIRAARFGINVESEAIRTKEAEIALRTGEVYTGLLLAEELFRLTGRIGNVLEQARNEIQRLLDEGAEDVDNADLFQVQLSEQEFFRRVTEVTQRRETAKTALRRQLLVPDGAPIAPSEENLAPLPFMLDSLDVYFDLAMENRSELAQARAGLQARQALVQVAQSNFYPKLFLGLSANLSGANGRYRQPTPYLSDPFVSRSLQAGLGVRQNLNFLQTRARVEQAEAERNQVRYQGEAAELLILFEVEEAYRNFIVELSAMEAQNESLRISREWLLTEMNNFEFDLGDTENLVRAVQASLELEATFYEAVQRHNVAILRLLDACGVLVKQSQGGTLVEQN